MAIPALRVAVRNSAPLRPERGYVLYWMIAARRTRWNFGLEHAIDAAVRLGKRLVVLEALRCDYRYASDRLHQFVLDGMAETGRGLPPPGSLIFPTSSLGRTRGRGFSSRWRGMRA